MVKLLLKFGAKLANDINMVHSDDGQTYLGRAVLSCKIELADVLIHRLGATFIVDAPLNEKYVIHRIVEDSTKSTKILAQYNIPVEQKIPHTKDWRDAVDRLVKINGKTHFNTMAVFNPGSPAVTPLHYAVEQGDLTMARFLVKHGCGFGFEVGSAEEGRLLHGVYRRESRFSLQHFTNLQIEKHTLLLDRLQDEQRKVLLTLLIQKSLSKFIHDQFARCYIALIRHGA